MMNSSQQIRKKVYPQVGNQRIVELIHPQQREYNKAQRIVHPDELTQTGTTYRIDGQNRKFIE